MNPKDNRETDDQSIVIEDLSAENAEASNVKGGPYKVVLEDCLVSSWQSGGGM
jgi:hypothetical protein